MSKQEHMKGGYLRNKLDHYAVDPPEKVWDAISEQLSQGRKRRGMYVLLLATAASIALAVGLGIHFFGPDLSGEQFAVEGQGLKKSEPEADRQPSEADEEQQSMAIREILDDEGSRPGTSPGDPAGIPSGEEAIGSAVSSEPDVFREPDVTVEAGVISEPQMTGDTGVMVDSGTEVDPEPELLSDTALELNTDPFLPLEPEKKRSSSWSVGAAISPLYSYRDADATAMPSNQAESGMLSYSTGLNIRYRRNSRFAIETGIYYNRTGIAIGAPGIRIFSQSYDNMIFGVGSETADINDVSNSVGNIVAYSGDIYMNGYKINAENGGEAIRDQVFEDAQVAESGIQQHLDFLELPFNLRYSVIDRTFELQLVGGFSTNFLVGNSVTLEGPDGRQEIGYLSNVNTVNYSGNAGLGMFYHMGSKTSLFLEPRFRYFLNSVNDATLPATRPYSIGFYTGLSYTF